MGRRKEKPDDAGTLTNGEYAAVVSAEDVDAYLKSLPPQEVGGMPNPEYYAARYSRQAVHAELGAEKGIEVTSRVNAGKMVLTDAKLHGITEEEVLDRRSPLQRVDSFLARLKETSDALLEHDAEKMLDDLDAAFAKAEAVCEQSRKNVVDDLKKKASIDETSEALRQAREHQGKALRSLLLRVRRLQKKIRDPHWHEEENVTEKTRFDTRLDARLVRESARPLQYMLYVARPPPGKTDTGLFILGTHHGKMALGLWLALNHAEVRPYSVEVGANAYEGAILVVPPGHGKTQFACAFWALKLCDNPAGRLIILHAQAGVAQENLQLLRKHVDPGFAEGRRTRALFPDLPRLAQFGNNAGRMTFALRTAQKSPAATAYGVSAKKSGVDADWLWGDDTVDQESSTSEATREETFARWNGTWMPRLRRGSKGSKGAQTFHLTTTTLWHPDDANCRRITLRREGKLNVLVSIQACGGPKENFSPLWPEVYGQAFLRKKYDELRNPRLYAACYQSDPQPESTRIVSDLIYYDPDSLDHMAFLKGSVKHLSLDPSATNRPGSDKVGMVYAAEGDHVESRRTEDGMETTRVRRKLRILKFRELSATQTELVEAAGEFALRNNVDLVHIETQSAFHGCAEMFVRRWGIEPVKHTPGNRNKEIRLRDAAFMLDAGVKDDDGYAACVEFPGVRNPDGTVGPDPDLGWAYRQIVSFGMADGDAILDATTQLVNWLRIEGRLNTAPSGTFSRRVGEYIDTPARQFERQMKEWIRQRKGEMYDENEAVENQDWKFAGRMG